MRILVVPFSLFYFVGCQTYQPYQATSLPSAESARSAALADAAPISREGPLSFDDAAALLNRHNPDLIARRAELEALRGVAEFATPRPNPELELGSGVGVTLPEGGQRVGPSIGVVFALPMGPRLQRADDVNAAKVAAAELALRARQRELYLALRTAYAEIALARRQVAEQAALVDTAAASAEFAIKLAQVGTMTGLDVNLLKLEHQEQRLAQSSAKEAVAEAERSFAEIAGISHAAVAGRPLEDVPVADTWPELEAIHQLVVAHNPDLGRLRGEFALADAELRLELANQIPDVEIGAELEQEVGEDKQVLGIGFGIELPLFDRNTQAIAEAEGRRDALRSGYEATLAAALASLDGLLARVALLSERRQMLEQDLLPLAKSALVDAERLLAAGEIEALRLLELQRRERELRLALLEADGERIRATLDIETIIGCPLLLLPGEDLKEMK